MSVKKKVGISDLLRDEAQKGDTSFDAPPIEVKAEAIAEQPVPIIAEPENVPAQAEPLADVLAKVSSLENALAAAHSREADLTKAIADLQKELQLSQTNAELLQTSLTASETLKNELEQQLVEVKRDNLRLAEANIQLSTQLKSLEQSAPNQLAVQPTPRATPRKQPVEQPYPHRDRNPYARPTGSNEQLQRVNNKNIGWMD